MASVEEGGQQAAPEAENVGRELLSRGRLLLLAGVFVMEMAIFFSAMLIPVDPSTQQSLQQAANTLRNTTSHASPGGMVELIFSNNVRIALAELIPGLGGLVFVYSIFITGQVIQVAAMSTGVPGAVYGALLFVFPFAIVELSGYALAVASGTMLIVSFMRKRLRREVRVFALEVVGVVVVLFVAAAMETATLLSPEVGLALWLPMGLFFAWMAVVFGRRRQ